MLFFVDECKVYTIATLHLLSKATATQFVNFKNFRSIVSFCIHLFWKIPLTNLSKFNTLQWRASKSLMAYYFYYKCLLNVKMNKSSFWKNLDWWICLFRRVDMFKALIDAKQWVTRNHLVKRKSHWVAKENKNNKSTEKKRKEKVRKHK